MYYFIWQKYPKRNGHFDYKRNSEKLLGTCKECGVSRLEYAEPVVFDILGEPADFYMVISHGNYTS